jgi:hypothetical protein
MKRLLGYDPAGTTIANGMLIMCLFRHLIDKDLMTWPEAQSIFDDACAALRASEDMAQAKEALRFTEEGLRPNVHRNGL